MKKESISVTVDAEKIRALNFYLGKRSVTVERELLDAFEKLYERNVPAPTREYIESLCDSNAQPQSRPRPRRTIQPAGEQREDGDSNE